MKTTTRHTTHINNYPAKIIILRPRHPLEGQTLDVFGWINKGGALHYVAILPDGSKSHIPAAWTNLDVVQHDQDGQPLFRGTIAAPSHLLKMRIIVDALLRQLACLDHDLQQPSSKEAMDRHATKTEAPGNNAGASLTTVGGVRTKSTKGTCSGISKSNSKNTQSKRRTSKQKGRK